MSTNSIDYALGTKLAPEQKKAIIKAIDSYSSDNFKKAIEILTPITEKTNDSTAFTCLGNCYFKAGDFFNARKYYEKAIAKASTNPYPFISYGNLYYEEGDIQKAILYWTVANTLVADDANLLLNLATAYAQKDFRIQSLTYYEKYFKFASRVKNDNYIKINTKLTKLKSNSSRLNAFGSRFYANKAIRKSIESYSSSVLNFPLQPQINLLLGNLFFLTKNYKSAIDAFLNAYITSNFNPTNFGHLPYAYEQLKMYSHAYCFYYILLSSKGRKVFPAKELKAKVIKYGTMVYRDDEAYLSHLELAKEFENDNNYLMAYVEYTNALILCKGDKAQIEASISKMLEFINPEIRVASNLKVYLNALINNREYAKAIEICDKILLLSKLSPSFDDEIRKKRKECKELLSHSENL